MKGYLERIAANAVRPRGTIHPFVGSMFSAARREPAAEAFPQHEEFTVADAGGRARATRNVSGLANDATLNDAATGGARDVRPTVAPGAERVPFEPLLPRQQKDGLTGALRGHGGGDESGRDAQSAGVHKDRPETRRSPSDESPAELLVPAERLVFEGLQDRGGIELARSLRQTLGESQGPVGGNPARRPGPDLLPHAVSPARELGEIQIHIGRIEVTAVPQAARPAPAPARKALSLDEYLRRRDGRAG
jgi:hypothetical protein